MQEAYRPYHHNVAYLSTAYQATSEIMLSSWLLRLLFKGIPENICSWREK